MQVIIAAVGRLKEGGERDLLARYTKRFDATGRSLALGPLTVVELAECKAPDVATRKADEAGRLLKAVGGADHIAVLDEAGSALASAVFAAHLGKLRDNGVAKLAFLIGGPDGHGDEVMRAARSTVSLGPMTLPHGLARVVLVEQLYRVTTILSGHPYHRA